MLCGLLLNIKLVSIINQKRATQIPVILKNGPQKRKFLFFGDL